MFAGERCTRPLTIVGRVRCLVLRLQWWLPLLFVGFGVMARGGKGWTIRGLGESVTTSSL